MYANEHKGYQGLKPNLRPDSDGRGKSDPHNLVNFPKSLSVRIADEISSGASIALRANTLANLLAKTPSLASTDDHAAQHRRRQVAQ